jgi:hypothetical protein
LISCCEPASKILEVVNENTFNISLEHDELLPIESFAYSDQDEPESVSKQFSSVKVAANLAPVETNLNVIPTAVDNGSGQIPAVQTDQPTVAIAQSDKIRDKKPLGWSTLDFSIPRSPAAKIIGYSGDVGAVSSPNELAVKLLNGTDSDGMFQRGFSIDVAPYLLLRGTGFTLGEYRNQNAWLTRFLANTKVSVATSTSDSSTARLGFGVEFVLINEGDPRFDEILMNDFRVILANQPQDFDAFDRSIKDQVRAAKDRARKRAAQKSIWTLGIGTSLISSTGRYFDFRGDGSGLWTTYRTGLGGDSELILNAAYRMGERQSVRNSVPAVVVNVDTLTTTAQIRTGSDNFKFSMEAAYNLENQSGVTSNSYLSYGLGVEPKISDNLWLSLSLNGSSGKQNGSDVQIFSGVKWSFNSGN